MRTTLNLDGQLINTAKRRVAARSVTTPCQPNGRLKRAIRLLRAIVDTRNVGGSHQRLENGMLDYSILEPEGVLVLKPDAPLKQEDFAGLSTTVDAYLAKHGKLHGALIFAKKFPGWEDVSGFTAHMHFVREHRTKVGRIAVVTDSIVADIAESIASFFTPAEVRRFHFAEFDAALAWVKT